MVDQFVNFYLQNRNLKSVFKLNLESYLFSLEYSNNLNDIQPFISVPISADNNNNTIIIAQQNGIIKTLKNSNLDLLYSLRIFNNNSGINDLKIRPNHSNQLLLCSNDRHLILNDIETKQSVYLFNNSLKSSFKILEFFDPNLFSTGNKCGQLLLYDCRTNSKKPVQLINTSSRQSNKYNQFSKQINGLLFNYLRYLYSSNDKYIKIFDLRFNKTTNQNKLNRLTYLNKLKYNGFKDENFMCLTLDNQHNLYALCTDNKIYSYSYNYQLSINNQNDDLNNQIKCFEGIKCSRYTRIKTLNLLNNNLLLAGSANAEVCIWSLNESKNNYINYPKIFLPHLLEEVSIVLCDHLNLGDIFTIDDGNNVYKWVLNSKLNNQIKKYKKGQISEQYTNKEEMKPFNLVTNKFNNESIDFKNKRKRILSNSNIENESIKRPFKRSISIIEKTF